MQQRQLAVLPFNFTKYLSLFMLTFFLSGNKIAAEASTTFGDCTFTLSGKYRGPDTFFADNLTDLNKYSDLDRYFYVRHIFDVNLDVKCPVTEFFLSFRNRAMWGNTDSIARTSVGEVDLLDGVKRSHSHPLPRNFPWIREIWARFAINEPLCLPINDTHAITVGAFPFQLGRGITLGDGYAVGPGFLGFYTDSAVDQYAYGVMLDGDCVPGVAHYALYSALWQNKTGSFADNAKPVRLHESGYYDCPARGFGRINLVNAFKLNWELFNGPYGRWAIEPYALFTVDPEQCVEYPADSSTRLGSFGIASEYYGPSWEVGFDTAFNVGRQHVRPWDRNRVEVENRGGQLICVNTHVLDAATKLKIPYVPTSAAQKLIVSTNRAAQCEALNGKDIGIVDQAVGVLVQPPVTLKNADNRFRNGSCNSLAGWMFVADGFYHMYPKCLSFGATLGVASGDGSPNLTSDDYHYSGFIGIGETYTGKRIKSAIVLPGRVVRPMGMPDSSMIQAPSKYPQSFSGFTNLTFTGGTINWSPCAFKRALNIRPNLLAYWQYKGVNKYDAFLKKEINCHASKYLGVEANVFIDYSLRKNLKLFTVAGLFFPGQHFSDIKGKPLNAGQAKNLDKLIPGAVTIPNIGNDVAYMVNVALELYF